MNDGNLLRKKIKRPDKYSAAVGVILASLQEQLVPIFRESNLFFTSKISIQNIHTMEELLQQLDIIKTEYGAIQSELQKSGIENPTIQDVSRAVIHIRQSKLPDPKEIGNAGSFFKNPTIPLAQFEKLKQKFENIQGYSNGNQVKVPAGWLIEQCGWKGKQIGNVASHKLQSLVIINATGKATGKEIFDFSTEIINSVKEKFGIELEREVNII